MPQHSTDERPKSCLVADDDDAIRKMIARLLKRVGYVVYEAADGVEALQHLRKTPVDLLVVDFRMPRLGGPGLIRILNPKTSQTRVIAMSGGAAPDEIIEAFEHNVLGFLHKPFHARELMDLIASSGDSVPAAAAPAPSDSVPVAAASVPSTESTPSSNASPSAGMGGAASPPARLADRPPANRAEPAPVSEVDSRPASPSRSPSPSRPEYAPTVNVSVSTTQAMNVQPVASAPPAATPVSAVMPSGPARTPSGTNAPVTSTVGSEVDEPRVLAETSPSASALFEGILREIDVETLELPVPDPVVVELIRLQTQPDISGAKVRAIVESSPSIARRVMQVANSAYYRSKESVKNLQQAIVRVGNRTVLSLALTMLHRRFYDRAHESIARAEWDHTVFTAIVAREMARRLGRSRLDRDPEEVYLTALFYNVGNAVLLRMAAERLGKRSFSGEALSVLTELCDRHHQRIGGRILRAWKLPSIVSDIAGSHHEAPKVSRSAPRTVRERAKLVHMLSLATSLSQEEGLESPVASSTTIHRDTSLAALGFRDVDVQWVLERSRVFRTQ